MTVAVLRADARCLPLPDASVDLVVTSPPYFGLRSYTDGGAHYDGQIGSEATPQEWLANLVACTAEWVRVLKPSGSIFVNLGDKYSQRTQTRRSSHQPGIFPGKFPEFSETWAERAAKGATRMPHQNVINDDGLAVAEKSLMGLPWRYALACTDQLGLILRRDIIWAKPNGLPESVTDRCRSSHEYVFHLVKQPRYYSAVDEIREPNSGYERPNGAVRVTPGGQRPRAMADTCNPLGKLPGSVWDIPSQPLTVPAHLGVDHFAAYPMELPRRIIAGWSPPGICTACGEGRRPVSVATADPQMKPFRVAQAGTRQMGGVLSSSLGHPAVDHGRIITGYACACPHPYCIEHDQPLDWCSHGKDSQELPPTRPAIVLDPFAGTGTTMLVAAALGRTGIGTDLSADYCRLAAWRTTDPGERARAMQVPKPPPVPDGQEALFAL